MDVGGKLLDTRLANIQLAANERATSTFIRKLSTIKKGREVGEQNHELVSTLVCVKMKEEMSIVRDQSAQAEGTGGRKNCICN